MLAKRRGYHDAANRWAGIGPYYAMFPVGFADKVVGKYTEPGQLVLDPFAGRGTAVFSAAVQGRRSIGIEINPVGYVYSKAKLRPASQIDVENRFQHLGHRANDFRHAASALPAFFQRCFVPRVQAFLLAARDELEWKNSSVDATCMALLLVYLHGKWGAALSNQMRQTKSMSPQYAIKWWNERGLNPPNIDPVAFMIKRLSWRYAKGRPDTCSSLLYLGDSRLLLRSQNLVKNGPVDLLFTSPPYQGVTNYHYDQWLRLWLLGGPPNALLNGNGKGGKFEGRNTYKSLLQSVFEASSRMLSYGSVVYVRTDTRPFTYHTTKEVLQSVFPDRVFEEIRQPLLRASQTRLFSKVPGAPGSGEVDFISRPR